jgi:hypothetical protein
MLPPISSEEENLFALLRTQTQSNTTLALALLKGQAIDPHIFLARWVLENAHHQKLYFAQSAVLHIWEIPKRLDSAQKQILSEHLKKIGAYIRPELEKFILEGILDKGKYPSLYLAGKFLDNVNTLVEVVEKNLSEFKTHLIALLKKEAFMEAVEFGEFLLSIKSEWKPILEAACAAAGINASAQALTFAKASRMGFARRFVNIFG